MQSDDTADVVVDDDIPAEMRISPEDVPLDVRREAELALSEASEELGLGPVEISWVHPDIWGDGNTGSVLYAEPGRIYLFAFILLSEVRWVTFHEARHLWQYRPERRDLFEQESLAFEQKMLAMDKEICKMDEVEFIEWELYNEDPVEADANKYAARRLGPLAYPMSPDS